MGQRERTAERDRCVDEGRPAVTGLLRAARRTGRMTESVIREMTRLALDHGAINLSQGYPDFDPPSTITEAAKAAIDGGDNQYTVTWGYPPLRERLAEQYRSQLGWDVDPL